MIKNIEFENIRDFSKTTLELSPETNIIVGSKGGGKSTLFDLLAGLEHGYILKNTKNALREGMGLSFIKAELINGEEIFASALQIKNDKPEVLYEKRYDVIFQADKIKTNFINSTLVEKEKKKVVKELLSNSPTIDKITDQTKSIYDAINKVISKVNTNTKINWNNSFKIKEDQDKLIKLLYAKNMQIENFGTNFKTKIKNEYEKISNIIKKLSLARDRLEKDKSLYTNSFVKNVLHTLDKNISSLKQMLEQEYKPEIYLSHKKDLITNSFVNVYLQWLRDIKQKTDTAFISEFKNASKEYFSQMGASLAKSKNELTKMFDFAKSKLVLNNSEKKVEMLTYKIDENLSFDKDNIYEIMKSVLYKPSKVLDDVSKWILSGLGKAAEGNHKEFNLETLRKKITDVIVKKDNVVSVYVDSKNYENMSLGEKSMFGIKYKFNHSMSKDLFLDQIEDNLDNKIIVNEIVKLINSKSGQKIIVTHNANIGILTDVKKVIIADKDDPHKVYSEGLIARPNQTDDSDLAIFLEGGTNTVITRLNKIRGEN